MKNRKGFTLVEVLIVVGIIGIITAIAIPSIMFLTKRSNVRVFDTKKEMILAAAKMYGQDNKAIVFSSGNTAVVQLKALIDNGYLEPDGEGTYQGINNTKCVIDSRNKECIEEYITLLYTTEKTIEPFWGDSVDEDLEETLADYCKGKETELKCAIYRTNTTNDKTIRTVEDDLMFKSISDSMQTGLWKESRKGKTENNKSVYFFRGGVQNNYVSFAGKIWRIVRINEDGSVKLILGGNSISDGNAGSIKYNSDSTISTNFDYIKSGLKTSLESWYNSNVLGTDAEKVSTLSYCNDNTNVGTTTLYYGAYTRIKSSKLPQFKCVNSTNNLQLKVAALTADEVVYAGGMYEKNNTNYYLYDNMQQQDWWLMSPGVFSNNSADNMGVGTTTYSGSINSYSLNTNIAFRPVVSLSSGTEITGGTGEKTNPYVVGEPIPVTPPVTPPEPKILFKEIILADNSKDGKTVRNVANDTMFSTISNSSQTGLWKEMRAGKTENNLPTYFFRDAAQNNYVSFANMMWRIVRINEDDTIRLILGGSSTTDGYGNGGKKSAFYSDYTVAIAVDYVTSVLKTNEDAWYQTNITGENDEKVATTSYCRDMSNNAAVDLKYGSQLRLFKNNIPQFKCPNSSDNLNYKIAGLTADEAVYAGSYWWTYNSTFYLFDNAQTKDWWTISPYDYSDESAFIFHMNISEESGGFINGGGAENRIYWRPVISLKPDVQVTGTGTQTDPYVVQ